MKKKRVNVLSFLFVVILLLSACSSSTGNTPANQQGETKSQGQAKTDKAPIVLGSTMALSGGAGYLGSGMKEVFDLVIKQTNEQGGINGREVKIIYYDDENSPEKAVQNAQKLIRSDKVKVILGPSTAQTTGAVQSIADKNKILMFSLSSAYKPPADSFTFNNSLGQLSMHNIHHEWFKREGIKKVGLIATTDSSGDISTDIIKKNFNSKDGIEYIVERMGLQELDATPQLTKLKSQGIQALVVIGPGAPPTIVIKNAGQLGFDIPILLTHSQASHVFAKSIKDIIPKKLYFASTAPIGWREIREENPLKKRMVEFAESYTKEYNKEVDHITAVGYDSIYTVLEAIKMAGSDDPKVLKETMETKFKNFVTSTAIVNYSREDHQGTNNDGAVLLKLNPDLTWHVEWEPKFWEK